MLITPSVFHIQELKLADIIRHTKKLFIFDAAKALALHHNIVCDGEHFFTLTGRVIKRADDINEVRETLLIAWKVLAERLQAIFVRDDEKKLVRLIDLRYMQIYRTLKRMRVKRLRFLVPHIHAERYFHAGVLSADGKVLGDADAPEDALCFNKLTQNVEDANSDVWRETFRELFGDAESDAKAVIAHLLFTLNACGKSLVLAGGTAEARSNFIEALRGVVGAERLPSVPRNKYSALRKFDDGDFTRWRRGAVGFVVSPDDRLLIGKSYFASYHFLTCQAQAIMLVDSLDEINIGTINSNLLAELIVLKLQPGAQLGAERLELLRSNAAGLLAYLAAEIEALDKDFGNFQSRMTRLNHESRNLFMASFPRFFRLRLAEYGYHYIDGEWRTIPVWYESEALRKALVASSAEV